jgi:hypothetical protein
VSKSKIARVNAEVAEFWHHVDRVGTAKIAALFRWHRLNPTPDPPLPNLEFVAAFARSLDERRNALLFEIFELSEQEPTPTIAAIVTKAVADAGNAERAISSI